MGDMLTRIGRLLVRAKGLELVQDGLFDDPDPLSVSLEEFDRWLAGVPDEEDEAEAAKLDLTLEAFRRMKADVRADFYQ